MCLFPGPLPIFGQFSSCQFQIRSQRRPQFSSFVCFWLWSGYLPDGLPKLNLQQKRGLKSNTCWAIRFSCFGSLVVLLLKIPMCLTLERASAGSPLRVAPLLNDPICSTAQIFAFVFPSPNANEHFGRSRSLNRGHNTARRFPEIEESTKFAAVERKNSAKFALLLSLLLFFCSFFSCCVVCFCFFNFVVCSSSLFFLFFCVVSFIFLFLFFPLFFVSLLLFFFFLLFCFSSVFCFSFVFSFFVFLFLLFFFFFPSLFSLFFVRPMSIWPKWVAPKQLNSEGGGQANGKHRHPHVFPNKKSAKKAPAIWLELARVLCDCFFVKMCTRCV